MSHSTLFRLRNLLLLSCVTLPLSYATNTGNTSSPHRSSYDYIVVGGTQRHGLTYPDCNLTHEIGGTAGNVVAARLTEDPKVTVLLLEAGVSWVHAILLLYRRSTIHSTLK